MIGAFLPAGMFITNNAPPTSTHPLGGFSLATLGGSNVLAAIVEHLYGANDYAITIHASFNGTATRITGTVTETWSWSCSFGDTFTGVGPESRDLTFLAPTDFIANAVGRTPDDDINRLRFNAILRYNNPAIGEVAWEYDLVDSGMVLPPISYSGTDDVSLNNFELHWATVNSDKPWFTRSFVYPAHFFPWSVVFGTDLGGNPSPFTGAVSLDSTAGTPDFTTTIDVNMTRATLTFQVPVQQVAGPDTGVTINSNTMDVSFAAGPTGHYSFA